jgi:hypothetical protein
MRFLILIFVLIISISARIEIKQEPEHLKAKRAADSIIFTLIDQKVFEEFWQYHSIEEEHVYDENDVWHGDKSYLVFYNFKKVPKGLSEWATAAVCLSSDFKLISVRGLMDPVYLTKIISDKRINEIKDELSKSKIWHGTFTTDSIPGKKTSRPYICFSTRIKSEPCNEGRYICKTDSCLFFDATSGDYVKWEYFTYEMCE